MSNYSAELKCIECGATAPLLSVVYRCSKCNGLLEVHHDIDRLKTRSATEWQSLFTERYRAAAYPLNSGVWGKKEWVLPQIGLEQITSLGEGATPLLPLPRLARELDLGELYIKQCGISHTGSFKDLGMTVLVSHVNDLIRHGHNIRAVACASTGDTSAALAAYATAAGIPTIVFLPNGKISLAQLIQPVASGAHVLSLNTDFDGCMKIVRELTEDRSIYLANSMNPLRIEGQKTISIEIIQQLNWTIPDWVIIPGGNLGNVSALGAGFKLLYETAIIDRMPRICLAQSANANPMYLSYQQGYADYQPMQAKKTLASAIQIGDPVSYPRAKRTLEQFDGIVEQASEEELSEAAARVDLHGMFNDPHTGVALAALFKLQSRGEIKRGESAVVISTAHGLKFTEFKTGYHRGGLDGVESRHRNSPVEIEASSEAVRRALEERLA